MGRSFGLLALAVLLAAPPARAIAPVGLDRALAVARQGHLDEAYLLAQRAAARRPTDTARATLAALLRQRAVLAHLERAHRLMLGRHLARAAGEFRAALALDPGNTDARRGLQAALAPAAAPPPAAAPVLRVREPAPPVRLQPRAGVRAFHLRAGRRAVIAAVCAAYGLRAFVANAVPHGPVRLAIGDATFAQAMAALRAVAGVDWIPLDPHTIYFAGAAALPGIAPLAERTFYLPWVTNGATLTGIAGTIRSLLGVSSLTTDTGQDSLTERARPDQLDATEQLLLDLRQPPGQVLLEIRILEVNASLARTLGLGGPNQFTMFALGPVLSQLSQSGSLAQQILQLFEQGGLSAVLNSGQLTPSQISQFTSLLPSELQNPFVVFGGGATLMALSVPGRTAQLSRTQSRVSSVETALLRADSGQTATLRIGQRYPIINASFSPISLSPAISQVLGSGGYLQPFPSFTYENLGLDAKLTPRLSPGGDIQLSLDVSVRALTGESNDNIPILDNRHVVTDIGMQNNQPVMIAGLLDQQEIESLTGLPGLSAIPGFARLFSTVSPQNSDDQLVLVITPHIVALPPRSSAAIWLPASFPAVGALPSVIQPPPGPGLIGPRTPLPPAPSTAPPVAPPGRFLPMVPEP